MSREKTNMGKIQEMLVNTSMNTIRELEPGERDSGSEMIMGVEKAKPDYMVRVGPLVLCFC